MPAVAPLRFDFRYAAAVIVFDSCFIATRLLP